VAPTERPQEALNRQEARHAALFPELNVTELVEKTLNGFRGVGIFLQEPLKDKVLQSLAAARKVLGTDIRTLPSASR
jgi:hypothetical protein